jgi:hypothetical protein
MTSGHLLPSESQRHDLERIGEEEAFSSIPFGGRARPKASKGQSELSEGPVIFASVPDLHPVDSQKEEPWLHTRRPTAQ